MHYINNPFIYKFYKESKFIKRYINKCYNQGFVDDQTNMYISQCLLYSSQKNGETQTDEHKQKLREIILKTKNKKERFANFMEHIHQYSLINEKLKNQAFKRTLKNENDLAKATHKLKIAVSDLECPSYFMNALTSNCEM